MPLSLRAVYMPFGKIGKLTNLTGLVSLKILEFAKAPAMLYNVNSWLVGYLIELSNKTQ